MHASPVNTEHFALFKMHIGDTTGAEVEQAEVALAETALDKAAVFEMSVAEVAVLEGAIFKFFAADHLARVVEVLEHGGEVN